MRLIASNVVSGAVVNALAYIKTMREHANVLPPQWLAREERASSSGLRRDPGGFGLPAVALSDSDGDEGYSDFGYDSENGERLGFADVQVVGARVQRAGTTAGRGCRTTLIVFRCV